MLVARGPKCGSPKAGPAVLLALGVEFGRPRLVPGRRALGDEREIVRVLHFDAALRSELVGIAVGIDWNAAPVLVRSQFRHAAGWAPAPLAEMRDDGFQVGDIFVHPDRP